MASKPAIVISAFNRPASLRRLLNSIEAARYDLNDIDLVISIDKSDSDEVEKTAEKFKWKYGEKKIILQNEPLGLKQHILRCGDLTSDYNAIILLEDDLMVSPYFYEYAIKALEYYKDDKMLAGISLYNYEVS